MGPPRKRPSPILELAPWVVLLIVAISANRMAENHQLSQDVVLLAFALVALVCGAFLLLSRFLNQFSCPGCCRMTFRRLVRHPRLFSCWFCGLRLQLGAKGNWLDARGPEFDHYYRPRTGTWLGAPTPEVDDTTCGTLLGRKIERAELFETWPVREPAKFAEEFRQTMDTFRQASAYLRRLPWSRPRSTPVPPGKPPAPGETTCGVLLRNMIRRRGAQPGGRAAATLWDREIDA